MNISSPIDLFFDQLRDIQSFETQLGPAFSDLSVKACSPDLRALLADHARQTSKQRDCITVMFSRHGVTIGEDHCKAIAGLIEGGAAHLADATDPQVVDLLMVAHCTRIKHYEIGAYSFTASLADCIGFTEDAQVLEQLLEEEQEFRRCLAQAAANSFDPCMLEQPLAET